MNRTFIRRCIALTGMACCGLANAHPGHGGGLAAGLAHPLSGLDHLLAMVAVGVWAVQLGGRATWLVPASFAGLMAVAAALGMAEVALPMAEAGIAISLLTLGLLVAFSVRVTPAAGVAIAAFFAIFHGHSHGAEMPLLASAWQYAAGFVLSTLALHGVGLALGNSLRERASWLRAAGSMVAVSGAWMMV